MFKKKRKQIQPNHVQVIIPENHPNPPEEHEIDAAFILAEHYRCTVEFLLPINDYKRTTPDFVMQGVIWEIKSPKGKSKNTIQEQFSRASKQCRNIIIDTRRTKLKDDLIENYVLFELSKRPYIKRFTLIDKSKKVVEIKK